MNSQLSLLHHRIIRGLLDDGACPSNHELAESLGVGIPEIEELLRALADLHGLVLHPHVCEPWVIHPFSLTPTLNWVQSGARGWWAPCVWCAFGVAVLAGGECIIHTRLAGESTAVAITVKNGEPVEGTDLFVHFAIPPAQAWHNVHQHCALVLPFENSEDIPRWCARHRQPQGEAVPLRRVAKLARLWYGQHDRADWKKWSVAEAQEIFARAGLTSAFWDLGGRAGRF